MKNSATTPLDDAKTTVEDLKNLISEAELALGNVADGASEEVQALRERLRDVVADGQATLKNVAATVRRQAGRTDDAIRAKPYQSIGIAAGVGILLGFLLTRACSSNKG